MKKLLIIPTYNEVGNLRNIIDAIFDMCITDLGILIVDDASPDGTGKLADELKELYGPKLDVIHRTGKLGLGTAYLRGFDYAISNGAEIIGQMDADFSHPPAKIPEMIELLNSTDIVIGSRYIGSGELDRDWPMWRKRLSAFGNVYASTILGLPINDVTAGFKLWRSSVLEQMPLDRLSSNGYAFLIEMNYVAHRLGFRFVETPIYFAERKFGESKMSFRIQLEAAYKVWKMKLAYKDLKRL